jgi:hypothetical protein
MGNNASITIGGHDYVRQQSFYYVSDSDKGNGQASVPAEEAYTPIVEPEISVWGAIFAASGSGCGATDPLGMENAEEDKRRINMTPVDQEQVIIGPDLDVEILLERDCKTVATREVCDWEFNVSIYSKYASQLKFMHYFHTEPDRWAGIPCFSGYFSALQNPDDPEHCVYPRKEDLPEGHPFPEEGYNFCINLAEEKDGQPVNRFPLILTSFEAVNGYNQEEVFSSEGETTLGAMCFAKNPDGTIQLDKNYDPVLLPAINQEGVGTYLFTTPKEWVQGDNINHKFKLSYAIDGVYIEGAGTPEEPGFIPYLLQPVEYQLMVDVKR